MLELLDERSNPGASADISLHVRSCRRCAAILAAMPSELQPSRLPDISAWTPSSKEPEAPRRTSSDVGVRTGAVWTAAPSPDASRAWTVAVIGAAPAAGVDCLAVAGVFADPDMATDIDVVLELGDLGYAAFVDMANVGTVLRSQLLEPVAQLSRATAKVVVERYASIMGGTPAAPDRGGAPVLQDADPRLVARHFRGEALNALWAPVHSGVASEDLEEDNYGVSSKRPEGTEAGRSPDASSGDRLGLSAFIQSALKGPDAEWDRPSLLEIAGIDGNVLEGFLQDQLDLTDRKDVEPLVRVFKVLAPDVAPEAAEEIVETTLHRSRGGRRYAEGDSLPMAARSGFGADPATTAADLFADRSSVDQSGSARLNAIAAYLGDFLRAFNDAD